MAIKKLLLFYTFALSLQANICFAQIVRTTEGDTFKWVLVKNNSTGEKGAEDTQGNVIVPMGKYLIVYHNSNGGFFELENNGIEAAYSVEGKELIPFSRGYNSIVRHKNYFGVEKNGLKGACDNDGYEIITPKYTELFYSRIDGFNTTDNGSYVPIGITQNEDGSFSGVDYSGKNPSPTEIKSENTLSSAIASVEDNSKNSSLQVGQLSDTNHPSFTNNLSGTVDKDQYRRSSLCLILLTHKNKKYAAKMERVFRNFPLPARYNEHNIRDLRVISVQGKQSKSDIDNLVKKNYVAQKVVSRWFNRSYYTGLMNMDLIHERGGYGAFYADYQRSKNNIRGTEMLRDEGIELLQSTFILVCDMDYIDKKKGAGWAAWGLALASIGAATMGAVNQQQAYNAAQDGNYREAQRKQDAANAWKAGSAVGSVATAVVADIGGFRVKMKAYLYKLHWDDNMTQRMYRDYWCDYQTSPSEWSNKKKLFENDSHVFSLEFIGKYQTTSSKTILRSWNDEGQVILDVCHRCVNKGLKELAQKFPIFKPRSPFYFEGNAVYSHIGNKEEVVYGKKYEIIQPYKDNHGQICYKRVGKAQAGSPWNNINVRFDRYFNTGEKGTQFFCKKASVDLHTPGLQLREL